MSTLRSRAVLAISLPLLLASAGCPASYTAQETYVSQAYVAVSEPCPTPQAFEHTAGSDHRGEVTGVDAIARVEFPARVRVCWYRVGLSKAQEDVRVATCERPGQSEALAEVRAEFAGEHAGEKRMGQESYDDHMPTPIGLTYNLKDLSSSTYDCVEGSPVVAEPREPADGCRAPGEEIPGVGAWVREGADEPPRVVEVAGVDELPDLAACFYRVHVDQEVRTGGSFGVFGP